MDALPLLIQVVNSGANLYICYGCLNVIKKLIHLSTSNMLVEPLKNANISRSTDSDNRTFQTCHIVSLLSKFMLQTLYHLEMGRIYITLLLVSIAWDRNFIWELWLMALLLSCMLEG